MKRSKGKQKKPSHKRGRNASAQRQGLDSFLDSLQVDVHHAVLDVLGNKNPEAALLEIAVLAGRYYDDVSAALSKKAFGSSDPRACTAGCAWCCYQMVTTTPPVVFFLARAVAASGPLFKDLLAEARATAEQVRGVGARERLGLQLPCPLLADDGACTVYPVRPLACRGWNTYDAAACRRSIEAPDTAPETRVHVPQIRVAHAVESGVVAALDQARLKADPVELIGALALALDDDTAQARWLEGQDVFAEVRPASDQLEAARWFARGSCP